MVCCPECCSVKSCCSEEVIKLLEQKVTNRCFCKKLRPPPPSLLAKANTKKCNKQTNKEANTKKCNKQTNKEAKNNKS